jgi:hypothetical protein
MSRTRKRWLGFALAVLAVGLVASAAVKVKVDRLDREAYLLAESGKGAIELLKKVGNGLQTGDRDTLLSLYAEGFTDGAEGTGWRETLRSEHHPGADREAVRVYDWEQVPGGADGDGGSARGAAADRLLGVISGAEHLEMAKLKLASVEEISAPGRAVVRSVLWLRGERTDSGDGTGGSRAFESQATLRFTLVDDGDGYRITGQELLRGRTVTGTRQGFTDVTRQAGLTHQAFHNPAFDTAEWNPKRFGILRYGSAGVTAADFDGDGWTDVFFAGGAASRLYRNTGSAETAFEDVTAATGLPTDLNGVNVAVFADLDNDGDQDLFLGRFTGEHRLYRNDGGRFTDVTEGAGIGGYFTTVAAAGDVDGDGLLDLYLGRYLDPRTELPTTLFYTRNSEGNVLLENRGDLRFEDVTEEAGVREGGLTLGVTFADYDEDGDQDLYVANDFGRNALFANRGDGTFDDVSEASNSLDFGYGMSATWGDVDNDGDLDLYTSNVHSGQRWYGQAPSLSQYLVTSIREGTIFEDFGSYREVLGYAGSNWKEYGDRVVKGNSLLLNDGGGRFADVAEAANANPFGWYWGASFLDYDNDGWQDVYAANGWITAKSHDDL